MSRFGLGLSVENSIIPALAGVGAPSSGVGAISVALPEHREGDLLILAFQTAAETVSTPDGWAGFGAQINRNASNATRGNYVGIYLFTKYAAASEGPVPIQDPGDHCIGFAVAFRHPAGGVMIESALSGTAVVGGEVNSGSINPTTPITRPSLILDFVANTADQSSGNINAAVNNTLTGVAVIANTNTSLGLGGGIAVITGIANLVPFAGGTTFSFSNETAYTGNRLVLCGPL